MRLDAEMMQFLRVESISSGAFCGGQGEGVSLPRGRLEQRWEYGTGTGGLGVKPAIPVEGIYGSQVVPLAPGAKHL